jgi:hypothetical protein
MFKRKGTKMETAYTYEFLQQRVKSLETEIELYKSQINSLIVLEQNKVDNLDKIKDWTLEQIQNGVFDIDTAQELAVIAGFDIKKDFEVTIQLEYTFTVKASTTSDVEDIINALDLPTLSGEEIDDYRVYPELIDTAYVEF